MCSLLVNHRARTMLTTIVDKFRREARLRYQQRWVTSLSVELHVLATLHQKQLRSSAKLSRCWQEIIQALQRICCEQETKARVGLLCQTFEQHVAMLASGTQRGILNPLFLEQPSQEGDVEDSFDEDSVHEEGIGRGDRMRSRPCIAVEPRDGERSELSPSSAEEGFVSESRPNRMQRKNRRNRERRKLKRWQELWCRVAHAISFQRQIHWKANLVRTLAIRQVLVHKHAAVARRQDLSAVSHDRDKGTTASQEDVGEVVSPLHTEGQEHFQQGKWMKAIACFTKEIKDAPGRVRVYADRAAALCEVNKFSRALQDADACVTLAPKWSTGHVRRGQALVGLGRGKVATEALHMAELCDEEDDTSLLKSDFYELQRRAQRLAEQESLGIDNDDAEEVPSELDTFNELYFYMRSMMSASSDD